eukprot:422021-Pyramimonas_sp.AAC.1
MALRADTFQNLAMRGSARLGSPDRVPQTMPNIRGRLHRLTYLAHCDRSGSPLANDRNSHAHSRCWLAPLVR